MSAFTATFRDTLIDLDTLIENRVISEREHPAGGLFIYNYTAKASFIGAWHPTTLKCRGLILDADGNIASRPFEKFFNLHEEDRKLPPGKPEVWEKLDGSLGISYWIDGHPAIATRGSFTSDQALRATAMLETQYAEAAGRMSPELTYLFEIIYPTNRVVVDYGDRSELRLLAVIETATGREIEPTIAYGFPIAQRHIWYENIPADELAFLPSANKEGFVLFWREAGHRVKVKFDDYVRMHRVVTGVSAKAVWETMRAGRSYDLDEWLRTGTPGFRDWLTATVDDLRLKYVGYSARAELLFYEMSKTGTRPELAERIKQLAAGDPVVQHCLFAMLDGKPYEDRIWKAVRPERGYAVYRKDGE